MTTTTKSERTKYENIANTTENLKISCAQFDSLVEQLNAPENVKNSGEVMQLPREEFSKEIQGFSLLTVKKLMVLGASVCQVRHNDKPIGTGCLLFEKCILTNAHVIRDARGQLLDKLSVSFNFEDLKTGSKQFAIKKKPLAYEYRYTPQHTMDYAVLELKTSAEALPPPLLKHYSAPPVTGGVIIIGHPAEGVKKMDMSLIIERSKQLDAVNKHILGNPENPQVIENAYFENRQKLDGSQIEYHSCFFHGSSGSPVFDDSGNMIGMHTGGYGYIKGEGSFDSVIEYAQPLLPILVSILRQTKDKRRYVWESFRAEKNTKLVVKHADDMDFRPESTNSCAWEHLTSDEEDMDVDP
ncbi:serine protease FAM111A-like [Clupea harengus]|uniref:Serine protease FAM111A-like n=1 Tax=Clupea harengus TaxID=7950 RepID=A0A8M1KQ66_CLUHA|nr:serine protease FAM111A-like [Clupea harengus]